MKHKRLASNKLNWLIIPMSFVLAVILNGYSVFASSCGGVNTALISCNEGGDGGIFHIISLVLSIMSIGIGILGVIGISIAGINYMTAGGDTAKLAKSKRRLFEIVIGIACYAVLYGVAAWLLPDQNNDLSGGGSSTSDSSSTKSNNSVSITYKNKTYVGHTFAPTVTLSEGYNDNTYSLISKDTNTVVTLGRNARCQSVGKATLEAVASDGKRASMEVSCLEEPETVSQSNSSSSSSSPSSSSSSTATVTGPMLTTKYNMKKRNKVTDGLIMRQETLDIINAHRKDFYYDNYHSYLQKKFDGKYRNYVKSLGGVFTKYAKTKRIKVETAADFQEAAEYVWGLWTIWGADYWNPAANGWCHNCKYWRQDRSWKGGRNDGFYSHLADRASNSSYMSSVLSINAGLADSDKVRTGCNLGCNNFIHSTNLKRIGGCGSQPRWAQQITNGLKLRVGDIIFFPGGGHVTLVGEVYKDYVVFYENGYRFTHTGNYKQLMRRQSGNHSYDSYSGYGPWVAYRPWIIKQNITLEGIN